jgi:hypothetical protein
MVMVGAVAANLIVTLMEVQIVEFVADEYATVRY